MVLVNFISLALRGARNRLFNDCVVKLWTSAQMQNAPELTLLRQTCDFYQANTICGEGMVIDSSFK